MASICLVQIVEPFTLLSVSEVKNKLLSVPKQGLSTLGTLSCTGSMHKVIARGSAQAMEESDFILC